MREVTCCHHMDYSFRLAARVLLQAPSHRQWSTYHGHCHTSCCALAGMRNSSIESPWGINLMIHRTGELHLALQKRTEYMNYPQELRRRINSSIMNITDVIRNNGMNKYMNGEIQWWSNGWMTDVVTATAGSRM